MGHRPVQDQGQVTPVQRDVRVFSQNDDQRVLSDGLYKKVDRSLEEIQKDADAWLQWYNDERPHSGKYCFGKTPLQTFLENKPLADEKDAGRSRPRTLVAVA
jgi:hypothetical protein